MSAYLLTCDCGKSVPVEIGQAGGRVACSCGKQIDVPTLRQLRHLPRESAEVAAASGGWGLRQGIIAASLIIIAAIVAWTIWSWSHDPVVAKFDPAKRQQDVEEQLIKTPALAWQSWVGYYKPLAESGFHIFQRSDTAQIQQVIKNRQFMRMLLLPVVGIFAVIAVTAAFWPKPKPIARRG
jgi:hypothetical protein